MPSPFIHIAGAIIVSHIAEKKMKRKLSPVEWLIIIVSANIPDLDFLPGLIIKDITFFHHGISHSLFFILCFSLFFLYKHKAIVPWIILAGLSHLLFDSLTFDFYEFYINNPNSTHPSMPICWPFEFCSTGTLVPIFPAPYVGSKIDILFGWKNIFLVLHDTLFLIIVFLFYPISKKINNNMTDTSS